MADQNKSVIGERKRDCDLKKSRILSPFISPCSKRPLTQVDETLVTKRIKYDGCDDVGIKDKQTATSQQTDPSEETITEDRKQLIIVLRKKEETLRKLNLVKMYRAKHNVSDLESLISKWRSLSQTAAQDLYDKFRISQDNAMTMGQFLDGMRISHDLIRYSEEEETFY